MPRGDKSSYTDKQKRMAEHIEEGYEERGTPRKVAEQRAWATVNKETGGGNKSGSGRGVPDTNVSAKKGGQWSRRRQGLRKPPGGGALALRKEGSRNAQAQCDETLGDPQDRRASDKARKPVVVAAAAR